MLHSTTITFFSIFAEVAEDVRRICGRYPPQKNARNCVTFLFPAEVQKTILRKKKPEIASLFALLRRIPPIFPKELQKNREKKPCKPPFLCVILLLLEIFGGGTSAKPPKSPKLRCFRCGRYKKASSAKRLSKTRKKPEIAWKNDCGGYAEGILRTIFRNFRRFSG